MAPRTKQAMAGKTKPRWCGNGSLPLSPDVLKRLYYFMLKCRMVEERARVLFREGKFAGNYSAAAGQEATEVGATIDLLPEDAVAPSHGNFVTNIVRGTPLRFIYSQLYACKRGPDHGRPSPAHYGYVPLNVITPASTIAAQLNIGTGVALAYKRQKKPNIVVALSGDGSTSLGLRHEVLTFAGVQKLPIVFVVENNLWAESTAVEDLSAKAQAYGFPGITVDGNDVVAVYRVCQEARNRARQGYGPTLVECTSYPCDGDSEIDQAKLHRFRKDEYWNAHDPIRHMERYLRERNLWVDEWEKQIADTINQEIEEALKFVIW